MTLPEETDIALGEFVVALKAMDPIMAIAVHAATGISLEYGFIINEMFRKLATDMDRELGLVVGLGWPTDEDMRGEPNP